jgi:hypothetical protein
MTRIKGSLPPEGGRCRRLWLPALAGRSPAVALIVATATLLVSAADSVSGQGGPGRVVPQPPMDTASKPWTGKRLPDGQPEVQGGIWHTPTGGTGRLDNPYSGSSFDSPEFDPWAKPRPSRIIDPPDGRIPYQPWALARQVRQETDLLSPTSPEHYDPQAQCLSGLPRLHYYVSNYQIVQSPGFIVFLWEITHMYRVIRLDDAPHVGPAIKLWMGDGIGRWEGNTLVVDTTNLNGKGRLTSRGDFLSLRGHDRRSVRVHAAVDHARAATAHLPHRHAGAGRRAVGRGLPRGEREPTVGAASQAVKP